MATSGGVIVWEWQNEFGSWRPYSPQITMAIENARTSSPQLHLGSIDPALYLYSLDLQAMCQVRQGTGTQRPIRRQVYPATTPIAKGVVWQWEADIANTWCDYDMEIASYVEDCQNKKQMFIDLTKSTFALPYHIDLKAMTQLRVETGRVRKIRKTFTPCQYPQDSAAPATSASSSAANGTKRKTLNKISSGMKRSRAGPPSASSAAVPPSVGYTGLNPAVANNTGAFPSSSLGLPGTSSLVMTSTVTSTVSSYGQLFGGASGVTMTTHQGPITRNMYNNTMAARSQQSGLHSGASVIRYPSGPNSNVGPHSLPQPALPFYNSQHASNFTNLAPFPPAYVPSGFGVSSGIHTGIFPMMGTSIQQQAPSSSQAGFQPNSTVSSQQRSILSRSKGSRIRPVIPNVTSVLVSTATPGLFGSLQQQAPFFSSASGASSGSHGAQGFLKHARIPNNVPKAGKGAAKQAKPADNIFNNYSTVINSPPADDDCCICCEKMIEASGYGNGGPADRVVIQLEKCSHMFHQLCLNAMYESGSKDGHLVCPTCKTIYGEKMGNCPRGEMEYRVIDTRLVGYEDHKTIQILYHIHSGIQGPEHPHPGHKYSTRGFPRIGYLPDCEKGRKVLQLLVLAWKRRLTFTVGMSTTTGEGDTVTWNEIHHKTELGTNFSGHGYPDPKYLDNVLHELAVHGITEADLPV